MIERAFTLRTDQFNSTTPAASFINPRCYGQDFALWLKSRLSQSGLDSSEPIQEDWGWVVPVSYRGHRFAVSIGILDESVGRTPADWRIGVAHEKALGRASRWFRPDPAAELADLAQRLEDVLRSDTRIKDVAPT